MQQLLPAAVVGGVEWWWLDGRVEEEEVSGVGACVQYACVYVWMYACLYACVYARVCAHMPEDLLLLCTSTKGQANWRGWGVFLEGEEVLNFEDAVVAADDRISLFPSTISAPDCDLKAHRQFHDAYDSIYNNSPLHFPPPFQVLLLF